MRRLRLLAACLAFVGTSSALAAFNVASVLLRGHEAVLDFMASHFGHLRFEFPPGEVVAHMDNIAAKLDLEDRSSAALLEAFSRLPAVGHQERIIKQNSLAFLRRNSARMKGVSSEDFLIFLSDMARLASRRAVGSGGGFFPFPRPDFTVRHYSDADTGIMMLDQIFVPAEDRELIGLRILKDPDIRKLAGRVPVGDGMRLRREFEGALPKLGFKEASRRDLNRLSNEAAAVWVLMARVARRGKPWARALALKVFEAIAAGGSANFFDGSNANVFYTLLFEDWRHEVFMDYWTAFLDRVIEERNGGAVLVDAIHAAQRRWGSEGGPPSPAYESLRKSAADAPVLHRDGTWSY